jgi:hypothetical protein
VNQLMVEALTAMPWWALVALVLLSRGPTWLRDWTAAVRTLRTPDAVLADRERGTDTDAAVGTLRTEST